MNVAQVLNCVLTTGEGAGLDDLCQGIVKRYQDAGEPEPDVINVDRDCCSETGATPVHVWFRPWKSKVRLDIFHYIRRFTRGLMTEHHPLYGTFCSKLSSCIYEWDQDEICRLKEAKRAELKKKHAGNAPTEVKILANISSSELANHCRRRTRGVEETQRMIKGLLKSMWELSNTSGLRLINPESMAPVWDMQQKHLPCIQDPPGVEVYTKLGSGSQKGDKVLDVLRCGRGSSSVESFHRYQCTFIPFLTVQPEVYILRTFPLVDRTHQLRIVDARGFPGWDAVDNLAEYLVSLNRMITALSTAETAEIVQLYSSLHAMDQPPSKYTLKSKKKNLPGPWSASRKRSGSTPGQQAAERLFMTHGQATQRPDTNRVSECVSVRLLKEYQQARNRPKDCKGKTLPIPQSIVQMYRHIKQHLEDSRVIQNQTDLVVVTINNTTVSSWLLERQKRTDCSDAALTL
ncbi:hypothetical protein SKAU_G00414780 [Synaphobranchus kaupii]|uniref:Uncharacterized protein n=1 Tax=Synaphobranchus kaupii TaxID=118154 RepID=A0A9Q1E756_SYNKA|nr:hypothetical protein SKAU_G00414780 [Synaphobranchus kaupii]